MIMILLLLSLLIACAHTYISQYLQLTQIHIFGLWEGTRAPRKNPHRHGVNMPFTRESNLLLLAVIIGVDSLIR